MNINSALRNPYRSKVAPMRGEASVSGPKSSATHQDRAEISDMFEKLEEAKRLDDKSVLGYVGATATFAVAAGLAASGIASGGIVALALGGVGLAGSAIQAVIGRKASVQSQEIMRDIWR